jgi:flagellar biosynthesis/type III secretory pathway protein FliH
LSSDLQGAELAVHLPRAPKSAHIAPGDAGAFVTACLREEFARGVAEGERRAAAHGAGVLAKAAGKLEHACERLAAELAADAVELAVEIARSIVRAEVAQNRHDVERIVRETLAASGVGRGACIVHLHPLDAERLKHVPFRSGTKIEADPGVAAGDVHVTTPHGVLVRDQEEILAAIRGRIRGELGA